MGTSVAATDSWIDPDNVRRPAGMVHAWRPGTNQTLCGLALSRSRLIRFAGTDWAEVQPATGAHADEVREVCRRCGAATGARRDSKPWTRVDPRP
ncbi:MAG TPA: hypothetical protein VEQ66_00965 [Propionibacteriaceae bacterium]|nr:hypothetical protein [Propionibacteriaceae bacterium]